MSKWMMMVCFVVTMFAFAPLDPQDAVDVLRKLGGHRNDQQGEQQGRNGQVV